MIYNIIISPIECIVDWIFNFILVKVEAIGVMGAVFGVSLAINFLALPLYNIADALQAKERKAAKALEYRVNRIKKAFKGDEQFMMISEYYRQNNYHPLYVLRSSLSILIEIPFFIAAYHYLSHNEILTGASFWSFKNLGAPDALFTLHFGSFPFTVNVLPILMTLINFVSGAIYLKECPFREKVQLYGIAVVFLALLYNSPSGLVLYWILNNIFSLVKNIVLKLKNPGRVVYIFFSSFLSLCSIFLIIKGGALVKILCFVLLNACVVCYPLLKKYLLTIADRIKFADFQIDGFSSFPTLLLAGIGLSLLAGFVLPSSVIGSSAIEFSFLGNTDCPTSYVYASLFTFLGFFVFWPVAIYKMFGNKVRKVLPNLFVILFITAVLNVFVFKFNYGNVSISFQLDNVSVLRKCTFFNSVLPVICGIFIAALVIFISLKKHLLLAYLCLTLCFAEAGYGLYKTSNIKKAYNDYVTLNGRNTKSEKIEIEPVFSLSCTKNNVIVLFIDRAIGFYFEKALEQFPELKNAYNGFVFYPNTVSVSTNTYLAYPAMTGGYEYLLEEINKDPRLLRDKFAEASLVQPKLFKDAGWNVTLSDIVKADALSNNQDIYSIFDDSTYVHTNGTLNNIFYNEKNLKNGVSNENADIVCKKQIKNFCLMQMLYAPLRLTFYNNMCKHAGESSYEEYISHYSTLYYLPQLFSLDSDNCNYIFIENEVTHCPIELDEKFEMPGTKVSRDSLVYYPSDTYAQKHYDVNLNTAVTVGKWLTSLQKSGAYDNTRIIIISDHGRDLNLPCFKTQTEKKAFFNPLLLYKDFNSSGSIKTDNSFMTNADCLFLACEGLNVSDKNPFTGKKFVQNKADGVNIYSSYGEEYNGNQMMDKSKFTLLKENGFHVSNNIFEDKNWEAVK